MDHTAGLSGTPESFIQRARRAQVVASAIAVMADVGYPKASFTRIAAHAGISPGLITYHFKTKDALVGAVVSEIVEAMETVIDERIPDAASYQTTLKAIIEGQVGFFADHTQEVAALTSIRAGAHDASTGQSLAISQREEAVSKLERFLRDGQAAGEFAPFDARLMAVSMVGALEMVPTELARRPETDAAHYGRQIATTFDAAVRREPAAGELTGRNP
jgi:AcrR family transcriptional regulator